MSMRSMTTLPVELSLLLLADLRREGGRDLGDTGEHLPVPVG